MSPHQVLGFAVQTEVNGWLLVPKNHCFLFEELGLCGTGKLSPSWWLQGLLGSRALLGSPCQRAALELSPICDIPSAPSVLPVRGNAWGKVFSRTDTPVWFSQHFEDFYRSLLSRILNLFGNWMQTVFSIQKLKYLHKSSYVQAESLFPCVCWPWVYLLLFSGVRRRHSGEDTFGYMDIGLGGSTMCPVSP